MVRKAQSRHEELLSLTLDSQTGSLEKRGFKQVGLNEYLYNGQRYDIVSLEEKGAKTVINLVHDTYEEDFLNFLTSFFSSSSGQQENQSGSILSKSMTKRFLATTATFQWIDQKVFCYFDIKSMFPSSSFLEIPIPPPKPA